MARFVACSLTILALPLAAFVTSAPAAEQPLAEKYLIEGRLADGQAALADRLKAQPDDDEARFGLGTLQFVRAVERLAQSLYKFGAVGPESRLGRQIPLLRLAVPKNPTPAKVRYADVREMLQQLQGDVAIAERTLAGVKERSVKLPLHFGLIRLDLNGDGNATDEETLWRIYSGLNRGLRLGAEIRPPDAEAFVIGFDYADVAWLRGYCHLLSSLCDIGLAYDQQSLFDAVGHHLFDNADAPALPEGLLRQQDRRFEDEIADAIAAIHLSHFPLKSPERMKSALSHLQQVIELSRENWKAIQEETDDDHEWIPSSRQTGVIPGVRVREEMIAGWHDFLSEAQAVLAGKKLAPHWRFNAEHGINLRRVFEEPREFDLVLWAHGAAAAPYAERGPVTTGDTWRRLQQMFGGQFIGFAFWFN
jgi:hypothetical protein